LADLGLDESRMLVATKVRLRTGVGHNDVGLGRWIRRRWGFRSTPMCRSLSRNPRKSLPLSSAPS
jgi:hypothetical protein